MAKLRGLLIDLDDTLYEYKKCNDAGVRKSVSLAAKKYKMAYKKAERIFFRARWEVKKLVPNQAASHSRLLYFKRMTELAGKRTDVSFAITLEKVFWSAYFSKMRLRKHAKELLAGCRKRGLKVCVVTNLTTKIQLLKIQSLGIGGLVDFVITSEEAGIEKPARKIIGVALHRIGCGKDEVIFAGNKDDAQAAKKAGIRFFLVEKDSDMKRLARLLD